MLAALIACAPHKPATPKTDNFPVAVPFAIDRAGSKVMVEFELPDPRDPDFRLHDQIESACVGSMRSRGVSTTTAAATWPWRR